MPKRHSVFIAATMIAAATLGGTATATADSMSDHDDDHKRGCAIFVENHRGDVEIEYVRTGTRSGDFVCRINGEWEHH
jgi:hypothetical protein